MSTDVEHETPEERRARRRALRLAALASERERVVDAELAPPSAHQGLLDVFRRRYLLRLLVKRELTARYQGSFLGLVWSYINPLSHFFIYWFVIGYLMNNNHGIPLFPVHIFAALTVAHFFTETFNSGTQSIVHNKSLVKKMALPREIFPVASMLVSAYHLVPQLIILVVVALLNGWTPDLVGMAALVLALLIAMALGTALALMFSVANVYFRDFGSFVGILSSFVHFGVPMVYSYQFLAVALPKWGLELYLANPISDAVLLIQQAFWVPIVPSDPESQALVVMPEHLLMRGVIMLVASLVLLVIGQLVFARLDRRIPERLE